MKTQMIKYRAPADLEGGLLRGYSDYGYRSWVEQVLKRHGFRFLRLHNGVNRYPIGPKNQENKNKFRTMISRGAWAHTLT